VNGKLRLGVSRCLMGDRVRYDGQHKHDRFLTDTLGRYVEYVPVCPEVEIGLPVPREAMRLVGDPAAPRLMTQKTGIDYTERMLAWAAARAAELERENLCGFIFKSRSPSSGMERIKVYSGTGIPSKTGVGIFAGLFMRRFPLLPVEDEGRLHDPLLRENFIERIFVMQRWRALLAGGFSTGGLVEFHTRHKLQLMAHSPRGMRELGALAAQIGRRALPEIAADYHTGLMRTLAVKATPARHTNVLMHIMGYFKRQLDAADKQELLEAIEAHRLGNLPLMAPLTLLKHYVRIHGQEYLAGQTYLQPPPEELQLRYHA